MSEKQPSEVTPDALRFAADVMELMHVDQVAAATRELLAGLSNVPYKPVKSNR